MDTEYLTMLAGLSLVYGMTHALDADHIMAVTGLNAGTKSRRAVRLCLSWALGHGFVLLLAGLCVYVLGYSIPPGFSEFAEALVGLLLILIGLGIARYIFRQRARLRFHQHEGLALHAHWQRDTDTRTAHDHRAVLVGMVHGAAGSAPLLAMIPLAQSQSAWLFLGYILIFVMGMFVVMMAFGGALRVMVRQLTRYAGWVMQLLRVLAATGSVLMGLIILRGLVSA